jgi:uncharacterized protein
VRRSGCGLLLDVNNIVVSAHNIGLDPAEWLNELPEEAIVEYHLAGHAPNEADGEVVLIDDHGSRVSEIEWDTDIPPLIVLLGEAERARRALARTEMSHAALAA